MERRDKRSIVGNTLISLAGQLIPLIAAVIALPLLYHRLGADRIGLLSLIWIVFGYFSVLDFGLGKAVTKIAAGHLAAREEKSIPPVFWTAALAQLVFGILGSALLILLSPILVVDVLNVPGALVPEATLGFTLSAISLPLVILSSLAGGLLEAAQRFDLRYAVLIPVSVANYLFPVLVAVWYPTVSMVVAVLLATRFIALVLQWALAGRVFPGLMHVSILSWKDFHPILSFGGWVALSNVIKPVLNYVDRFMIGSLLTLGAVAYYSVPYDLATRMWIVPTSLLGVMFPVFAGTAARGDRDRLEMFAARTAKSVLCVTGPLAVFLIGSADDIMTLWMGAEFAAQSSLVLQLLAVGVVIDSVAAVPNHLLQSIGRADVATKIQIVQLPLHVFLLWWAVLQWGVAGAAGAWGARVILDATLFYWIAYRVARLPRRSLLTEQLPLVALGFVLIALLTVQVVSLPATPGLRIAAAGVLLAASAVVVWRFFLGPLDREDVAQVLSGRSVRSQARKPGGRQACDDAFETVKGS